MSEKDVACFWIVLLLCQELRTDPIAEMGPSSGILIQETPGFILTEKRILTRRVFISFDPKIPIETTFHRCSFLSYRLGTRCTSKEHRTACETSWSKPGNHLYPVLFR
ncbi:Hypothetical predicted protein [Pelobates cultripes]|uniref:Secreted protein n=1 Tax=Pelobates cultripes TaxID=61616 RepID=A0AAD1W095_PELCU|nr:Hypothetical predicted protein [Pelobates cultripes]CAH2276545.1 Hypothetical predicted protein [Pelobates cultripes]